MVNHILAIGIDNYNRISRLNNCIRDLENSLDILTDKYDFEKANVTKLYNQDATQENIIFSLEEYFAKQNSGKNLIILFSGHGEFDSKLDLGYFLPVETVLDNKSSYIPNSTLFNYVKGYDYRHVVLISDTCFSGSLFAQTRGLQAPNERLFEIPSKWALTSGRLEKVSDGIPGNNSPFAHAIINSLKDNSNSMFSISELTRRVVSEVANKNDQIPRGAPLQILGDKGGEFFFKLKTTSKIVAHVVNLEQEELELKGMFEEYYSIFEKLEDAENLNKSATVRRLGEELKFVENATYIEISRLLELEKNKVFQSKRVEKILGIDIEKKYQELKEIAEEKNRVVKSQKFHEAADLRDKEKLLQTEMLKIILNKREEIIATLAITKESIKYDFAVLSILADIVPTNNKGQIRTYINDNFRKILFLKLSNDFGFISNFRFVQNYSTLRSEVIPNTVNELVTNKDSYSTSEWISVADTLDNQTKAILKESTKPKPMRRKL